MAIAGLAHPRRATRWPSTFVAPAAHGRDAHHPVRSEAHHAACAVTPGTSGARRRGQKRDPKELEALTSKLRSYIAKHPGQRIEQIGRGIGLATKELALPAKKLIAAKQISTKGQKRATTYFPKS